MAHHLTSAERDQLAEMLTAGHSKAEICRTLGRDESTIYRELHRNSVGKRYHAAQAQHKAEERQRCAHTQRRKMLRPEIRQCVVQGLKDEWSPDEIAGHMRCKNPENCRMRISPQTIYNWIRRGHGRPYRERLRRRGKVRKRRMPPADRARRGMDHRPEEINNRSRCGDWEGDLIVSGGNVRAALITLVERKTGYTLIIPVPSRHAKVVRKAITRRMKRLPEHLRLSVTFDNGTEFSDWEDLANALHLEVYFTHPRSPWERGTNENTNGLIRQYFPKGIRFDCVTRHAVRQVQKKLNDRPRKRLNYETPNEALQKQCYRAIRD